MFFNIKVKAGTPKRCRRSVGKKKKKTTCWEYSAEFNGRGEKSTGRKRPKKVPY